MTEMMDQQQGTSQRQALAISAKELAELLNVSLRQVWRLTASGRLPKPMRIGGSVRWSREEILLWFRSGCPDREAWEAAKEVHREG